MPDPIIRRSRLPGWQNVSFANYRLGKTAYRESIWRDIAPHLKDRTDVKLITISGAEIEDSPTAAELWNAFRYPWVGKGSPEQAQIAIQILYRFHKAHTALNASFWPRISSASTAMVSPAIIISAS